MKIEIKKKMKKLWRGAILIGIGICAGILGVKAQESLSHFPTTGDCPICGIARTDSLVLVDVRTGCQSYIEVWLPHEQYAGEVADWDTQLKNGDHSTFSFLCGGLGVMDSHMGGADVRITPSEEGAAAFLCGGHRGLSHYVLVDPKQTPNIAYPVTDGAEYEIRHYAVHIHLEKGQYQIQIESSLFAEQAGAA